MVKNETTDRILDISGIIGVISLCCMAGSEMVADVYPNLFIYGALGILQFLIVCILVQRHVEVRPKRESDGECDCSSCKSRRAEG